MQNRLQSPYNIIGIVFLLYLLPLFLLCWYSTTFIPLADAWEILSYGLLATSIGSFIMYVMMRQSGVQTNKLSSSFTESPQAEEHVEMTTLLRTELEGKNEELEKLREDFENAQQEAENIQTEFSAYKEVSQEQLEQKNVLVGEYQKTINEQRDEIIKQQKHMTQLENKIRDLNYEMKTVLQVADIEKNESPKFTSYQSPTPDMQLHEAVAAYQVNSTISEDPLPVPDNIVTQLKRCLDIAQKITGATHYAGSMSRFRDLSANNYALDLRRLFDTLRSETAYTILVYSQKEHKVLFVNNSLIQIVGWSPEKFIQNFEEIILEGVDTWEATANDLSPGQQAQVDLVIKTKTGEPLPVSCYLGGIPTGIFRQHAIGILYEQ